ncbi:MAG: trigger factor, partial [Clostridia bacterium]|nr:trigger factor [Clostridia bacterium]
GEAYDAALSEHGLLAVDKPEIDIDKISLEEGVVFTAEVQLMPTVTLGAYKGIEVEIPSYTVGDAELEAELDKEREKNARFIDVERAVQEGDRVVLDYSGSVDGEKFEGGTAEDQTIVVGSGTFIPGFEEQMVGMRPGESRDIQVKFPEEYTPELAGKDAVFAVTVKAVQIKELPALDDEFAKDVSEFDTLEALKEDRRKTLTEEAEEARKTALENACVKAVTDAASVDIPKAMVDRQINYTLQDMAYRLASSGISLEDYCKYIGTDMASLKESYREGAEARVKMQLVVNAIGKAEGVACTEEELERKIAEYAELNGAEPETFKKGVSEDDRDYLRDRVIAEKSVRLVVDNAVVKEKKPEKAAAKKKAPAKKKAAEADQEQGETKA